MKTFLVAIPFFDANMSVQAYRLCDRNANKLFGTMRDYQEMGDVLLSPGLSLVNSVGIEPFTGDKVLFADINQYQLLMGVPTNMSIDPSMLVCTFPRKIPQDDLVIDKCRKLKELGYALAMEGLPDQSSRSEFVDLMDYVMLDCRSENFNELVRSVAGYLRKKKAVITNVPDVDMYERLNKLPNTLFGGSFYSQPITRGISTISPLKVNALQLLRQVSEDDFDLTDIAKTIERDPAISISLLRFINSPAVGVIQRIDSIKSAVAILGQKEVKRWVTVAVSVKLAEDRPGEITKLALVRAKFAENLAGAYEMGLQAPSLFMAGLFSLLDVILEKPMVEAIKEVAVDERVYKALVEKTGNLYEVLDLIYEYERANWDRTSINMIRNHVDAQAISNAFVDALVWYKKLLEDIDEE